MEHNTLQGVIFDLDGTLLDSGSMWRQVDKKIMDYYGKEMPDDLSETVQRMSIEEFSRYFVEQFHLPVTPEQFAQQVADTVAQEYRELLPLKPHVIELLDWLDSQQIVYGVATATYGELAEAALKRLHVWERLAFLLTEQEAGAPKTQPRSFSWRHRSCIWADGRSPWQRILSTLCNVPGLPDFSPWGCMMQPIRRHGSRSVRRQRCMCTIFWK